jgi:hypothetical protein
MLFARARAYVKIWAHVQVVRMTADGNHYIGLRLPSKVISAVKKQLDAHNDLLLGKVLQVVSGPQPCLHDAQSEAGPQRDFLGQ